jgi:hypothetical protein
VKDEYQLLKTFIDPVEANITKGLLEANGIPAFICDENTITVNPILTTALGGIRLMVRSSDYKIAHAIIEDVDEENSKEILKCPVCGSEDVKTKNPPNWIYFFIMLFSFAITPRAGNRKKYICNVCRNRWSDAD